MLRISNRESQVSNVTQISKIDILIHKEITSDILNNKTLFEIKFNNPNFVTLNQCSSGRN